MAVTINGSTGIVVPDGTAGAPSTTGSTSANIAFTTNTISFNTNSAERMRIDTNGNFLVGTISNSNSSKTVFAGSATASSGVISVAEFQGGGVGENGGQIRLLNTYSTATSPSKWLRVNNTGSLHVINNAYTTVILALDDSGNLAFNSGYGSVATAYGCRAWVNYNATGSAIRSSGGLSSVTKNGTGDYTLNLSTTMPDTSYSVVGTANAYNAYQGLVVCIQSMSTTTVNIRNTQGNNNGAAEGNISGGAASMLCISIFR